MARLQNRRPTTAALLLMAQLVACSFESAEVVELELKEIDTRVSAGVAKMGRALADPTLEARELGDGVRQIEKATRALAKLEVDVRATESQQLMAIVYQARAWDDVATTYVTAVPPPQLALEQRTVFLGVLAEKALPAAGAAQSLYERARERACRLGLAKSSLMTEIVAGMMRGKDTTFASPTALESPCLGEE